MANRSQTFRKKKCKNTVNALKLFSVLLLKVTPATLGLRSF